MLAALAGSLPTPARSDAGKSSTIAARRRFFGAANVDPRTGTVRDDRVILSWFGVAGYAAALNGHVVLLDAWVARGSHSRYVPITPEEIAALDPEYVFLGHGDFDHAADAAEIVTRSGATLVGSKEHCDSVRGQAPDAKIKCVLAAPEGAAPGFTKRLDILSGVDITAVTHIHSAFEAPASENSRTPCPPIWSPEATINHPPNPEDVEHLLRHLGDTRGGNILYQFRVDEFSFAWHDTTGPLKESAPQALKALRALPPTDLQLGAVLAFGQVTNCLRSLRMYIDALRPRVFAPTHHDNFTFLLGATAEHLEPYVRAEIQSIPKKHRPKLLYYYDPKDYISPDLLTFDS
jgi:hypothetical protein